VNFCVLEGLEELALSSSASVVRGCAHVTASRAFLATRRSNMVHIASLSNHLPLGSYLVPGGIKMPSQLNIFFFNMLLRLILRFWPKKQMCLF